MTVQDENADVSDEVMLQYRLAAAFAELVVGTGSATLTLTPRQLSKIAELTEGDESPEGRSLKLLVELAIQDQPRDVSAGGGGDVVPFGRSGRVVSQEQRTMSINHAYLLTRRVR